MKIGSNRNVSSISVCCSFSSCVNFGRPVLTFHEKLERSKRREIARISSEQNNDSHKLLRVYNYAARQSGQTDIVAVLEEVS